MVGFVVSPVGPFPSPTDTSFPEFLQFQANGTNLGDATATTVNFGAGLTATRGTGTDAGIVTVEAASSGVATVVRELTADYTLQSTDTNTIFYTSVPVTVTIDNLATPPACAFIPQASGSFTLHPLDAVHIDGATDDVPINVTTHPGGCQLRPWYGTSNWYSTTLNAVTFGDLGGLPSDNAALQAAFDDKKDRFPTAPKILSADYTLLHSDSGRLFYITGATSHDIIVPGGLPNDFEFYVAVLAPATGHITVVAQSGVTFVSVDNNFSRVEQNAVGHVRCAGGADTYTFTPDPYWTTASA